MTETDPVSKTLFLEEQHQWTIGKISSVHRKTNVSQHITHSEAPFFKN
jgi:hypothetical protein